MLQLKIDYTRRAKTDVFEAAIPESPYTDLELRTRYLNQLWHGIVKSRPITMTWATAKGVPLDIDWKCVYRLQLRCEGGSRRAEWHVWYETEKRWELIDMDVDMFGMTADALHLLCIQWRVDTLYCWLEQ